LLVRSRDGSHGVAQFLRTPGKVLFGNDRSVPGQRPFGRGVVEVPRHDVDVEVRDDVAEQLIVDVTRFENAFDGAADILNVQPVVGQFGWGEIRERRNVSGPEDDSGVTGGNGMAFEQGLADSAAVERSAGHASTKRTADALLARVPIRGPRSCHATALR